MMTYEWIETYVFRAYRWFKKYTISINNDYTFANTSSMYKCVNSSKYISKSRLFDNIDDCYRGDDEYDLKFNQTCLAECNLNYFRCRTTNQCIPTNFVGNNRCQCTEFNGYCDDENPDFTYARHTISL
jgi:hypothetical protein